MIALECRDITKTFFGLVALDHVGIEIKKGSVVGLIGPNGSGKTTLFNCITGYLKPSGGRVFLNGEDITGKESHEIAHKGITRTFQLEHVFGEMSVVDNMIMGLQQYQNESIIQSIFRFPSAQKKDHDARLRALELLDFLSIKHLKDERAKSLSFGQRKLLSLGMALMRQPQVLMLDEPAASVNPTLVAKIKEYIRQLNERGLTIFLVEHDMSVVLDVCQWVYVLNQGKNLAQGTPDAIRNDEKVVAAYFGG